MGQSDKQRKSPDATEQVQDLPSKSVEGAKIDQVKGGADPVSGSKLGTKTVPPIAG